MSAEALSGGCLCGAVRFTATPTRMDMTACHCSMCRRWCAGPMMTVDCDSDIAIDGVANLGVYISSDYGERCFCTQCGTTLFWRMQDRSLLEVSAQAFDEPQRFAFALEIYTDEQPAHYAFANATKRMTGAEFVAFMQAGKGG